ncbi:carbamoyltransferase [Modestobacter sp. I12A-02628]|uniref:Carbamoyltransferase n=1 Tax=Goekera deserti TaxID=2497753 RepID=A0A7K3WDA8_9ACTN|nr:carbamoyltransferase [Goekera deserti]NDI46778.1 carbamoyltransferase [Goekera deserti]NEL54347.1 carbamoyltransferase [Goekera deserti]
MRVVLAINFNHDGSAVVLVDGVLTGYVCTERRSRLKKHPGLREEDLDAVLADAGVELRDVGHVLLCNLHSMDSPDVEHLHGSDLKETWLEFWVNQLADRVRIRDQVIPCTVNPDHHLIHAAAPFYTSPFDAAMCLAIDPTGCRAFVGRGGRLYELRRGYDDWFTANVGYTSVSVELFGSSIVGAGKVMGLAPYGRSDAIDAADWTAVRTYEDLTRLADAHPVPVLVGAAELNASLAYAVQIGLERQLDAVLADLAEVARRNGVPPNLCLAGGTALNAVANQACFSSSWFERLHLHPACGDDGTAIGAALWHWHHVLGNPRRRPPNAELMYGTARPSATDVTTAVREALSTHGGRVTATEHRDVGRAAAELIAGGATVGWFEGAGEIGPRALGHRSILADPRDPGVATRLNAEIKFREPFRPFAPAVLAEHSERWFGLTDSPFMLRACPVLKEGVPAITHVDGTSRIQTVTSEDSPGFHTVLDSFHDLTGLPMLLSTSLNTRGCPIDETPADALGTLLQTGLDHLALPGVLLSKRQ